MLTTAVMRGELLEHFNRNTWQPDRQTDRQTDIAAQTGVQTSLRDIIYALTLLVGRQEEYAACKS